MKWCDEHAIPFPDSSQCPKCRRVIWFVVTTEERAVLEALAERDHLTIQQLIRECVNDRLVEEGDDIPLLKIRERGRRQRRPLFGWSRTNAARAGEERS